MSKIDKIFDVVDKLGSTVSKANEIERTVDRVEDHTKKISSSKSSKWKWVVMIIIVVIATLYIFLG